MPRERRKRNLLAVGVGLAAIGLLTSIGLGASAKTTDYFGIKATTTDGAFTSTAGFAGEPKKPETPKPGPVKKTTYKLDGYESIFIERSTDIDRVSPGDTVTFTMKFSVPAGNWTYYSTEQGIPANKITKGAFSSRFGTGVSPVFMNNGEGDTLFYGRVKNFDTAEIKYSVVFDESMAKNGRFETTNCTYSGVVPNSDNAQPPADFPAQPTNPGDGCITISLPVVNK